MTATFRASLITLTLTALTLSGPSAQAAMPGMHHAATGTGASDLGNLPHLQGQAFDRAFLSMMVPHHQMAVDMARAALPLSRDATVKAWATAVIRDQTREITQMNSLLKGLGSNSAMANHMKGRMTGMADSVRKASNPDVAFVQGMLPHHASAIDMANLALQRGQDARVLTLARSIITAQATEMLGFRTWLSKRGL
ncbi:DUF305 domain-containing protein [Deinococcus depolymerans]|uniref:DUF305 domain-containing protein n=1 Tax=Deinococcus depolymerans TaxID=392408 RepID=A0ABP3MMS4_9DEIO